MARGGPCAASTAAIAASSAFGSTVLLGLLGTLGAGFFLFFEEPGWDLSGAFRLAVPAAGLAVPAAGLLLEQQQASEASVRGTQR
jgi:hypothetical protein